MPRGEIAEVYGSSVFNLLRSCQTVFHSNLAVLHLHQPASVEMIICALFFHLLKPILCVIRLDFLSLQQEEGKSVQVILSWLEAEVPQIWYFELSPC